MNPQEMELAYRTAVPLFDVDYLYVSQTEGFAIAWIDTRDRPDLSALSSPNPMPDGSCILTWFYSHHGERSLEACLRVEMQAPVRFAFTLIFPVARYIGQLRQVTRQGQIWVVPGPPPEHLTGTIVMKPSDFRKQVTAHAGTGLLITIEDRLRQELSQQLVSWQRSFH